MGGTYLWGKCLNTHSQIARTFRQRIELGHYFTFSPERSQTSLRVSKVQKAEAQVHCSLWVTKILREPVWQCVGSTREPKGGVGLNLYLVHQLVWSSQTL